MQEPDILFYGHDLPHFEFSNFAPYPIEVLGKTWPTSEHFFQAMKFLDDVNRELIRTAPTPARAAELGRSRDRPLRSDWEIVKNDIMTWALMSKFEQYPDLKAKLFSTGNAKIIEHTDRDKYWGDGGDGSGKNMLGILLMEVRRLLK